MAEGDGVASETSGSPSRGGYPSGYPYPYAPYGGQPPPPHQYYPYPGYPPHHGYAGYPPPPSGPHSETGASATSGHEKPGTNLHDVGSSSSSTSSSQYLVTMLQQKEEELKDVRERLEKTQKELQEQSVELAVTQSQLETADQKHATEKRLWELQSKAALAEEVEKATAALRIQQATQLQELQRLAEASASAATFSSVPSVPRAEPDMPTTATSSNSSTGSMSQSQRMPLDGPFEDDPLPSPSIQPKLSPPPLSAVTPTSPSVTAVDSDHQSHGTQEEERDTFHVEDLGLPYANQPNTHLTPSGDISLAPTTASSTYGEDRQKVTNKVLLDPYGDKGTFTGFVLRSTGMPHGPGRMIYEEDNRIYEGDWRHGRWHGHGKASFSNGDSYEGEYKFDQRHGRGVYFWSDGRAYDGAFSEDKRHGKGVFTWPDGAVYDGDFCQGQREGHGTYTFADGGQYDGAWENGKYEGYGSCVWADGRKYVGNWHNGMAHGQGTETYANGSIRHEGQWIEDEPVR